MKQWRCSRCYKKFEKGIKFVSVRNSGSLFYLHKECIALCIGDFVIESDVEIDEHDTFVHTKLKSK